MYYRAWRWSPLLTSIQWFSRVWRLALPKAGCWLWCLSNFRISLSWEGWDDPRYLVEDQFLANLEACSPGPESSFPRFQDLEKSLQCQAGLKLGTCGQGIFWKVKKKHVSHFVICFIYHYDKSLIMFILRKELHISGRWAGASPKILWGDCKAGSPKTAVIGERR